MCKLEAISVALHVRFEKSPRGGPRQPYADFRNKAYEVLKYYVDYDFTDAFKWYLAARGKSPMRTRIKIEDNPFHWGLLAMSVAAMSGADDGGFLSANRLRD